MFDNSDRVIWNRTVGLPIGSHKEVTDTQEQRSGSQEFTGRRVPSKPVRVLAPSFFKRLLYIDAKRGAEPGPSLNHQRQHPRWLIGVQLRVYLHQSRIARGRAGVQLGDSPIV